MTIHETIGYVKTIVQVKLLSVLIVTCLHQIYMASLPRFHVMGKVVSSESGIYVPHMVVTDSGLSYQLYLVQETSAVYGDSIRPSTVKSSQMT